MLLFVSRIAAEKNLRLALAAYDAVRARQPGARMVWVGAGPALPEWQRERPDLIFAGVQRDAALAHHFASADLFVFPSLSETFGNVTLEALASGLPVVAFDYGAAHAHVRSGIHGKLAPCGDATVFTHAAAALADELADDAGARARYRAATRAAVARLSHRAVAAQLVELFAPHLEDLWRAA